ncbi:hypothetical protein EDC56_0291 [Sinobacterium caligoides]|uniref:Uncharacterized protein n=1 Tax=Sinobacterium caligoides TaxID=933926 RepID=A0A3N2DY74_9GAMM|nr:hypothetical protein [Sinobacterium caligoides]ROS04778.1 hypothetical protein EDC56_0291 [Sinobacterium caligoides]
MIKNILVSGCIGSCLVLASQGYAQQLSPSTGVSILSVSENADNTVTINGKAGPTQAITDLTINGYQPSDYTPSVAPTFSLTIPASDHYEVVTYDQIEGTRSADYVSGNTSVENAVQLAISDGFLTEVGPVVETLLEDISLTSLLDIDSNECVFQLRSWRSCDLYLREMGINGRPEAHIFFSPNGDELTINIGLTIPEVALETSIKRQWWWGYRNTRIAAKNVTVTAQIGVTATDNQSIKLVLDDPSDIFLNIGALDVNSNTVAAKMIPLFRGAITTIVNNHLVNLVGPVLSKLEIPEIPLSLPLDIDGDSVNDGVFDIALHANKLSVTDNSDGVVSLGGSISVSKENTAPGRSILGYRVIEGELPSPELGSNTDIKASLSVSFVNQIVAALYQSGIEEKISIPLKVGDLGSFGGMLANLGLGYTLDSPMFFEIGFGGLPEITLVNDAANPLGLQLVAPELRFRMLVDNGAGTIDNLLDLDMDIAIATSLGAHADGKLDIDFNDILAMNITKFHPSLIPSQGGEEYSKVIVEVGLIMMLDEFAPMIEELSNAARLDLDLGSLLNDLLKTNDFASIPATGYVTEAETSDDNAYMSIGLGVDFN